MTTGWECPICKSVWAPSVLRCQNNHGAMGAPVPVNPLFPWGTGGTTTISSGVPNTVTYVTTAVSHGPVQVYGASDLPAGYTVNALRAS